THLAVDVEGGCLGGGSLPLALFYFVGGGHDAPRPPGAPLSFEKKTARSCVLPACAAEGDVRQDGVVASQVDDPCSRREEQEFLRNRQRRVALAVPEDDKARVTAQPGDADVNGSLQQFVNRLQLFSGLEVVSAIDTDNGVLGPLLPA